MLNNPVDEIIKSSNTNYTFDDDQLKIVNYYSQNRSNIVKQLTKNLGKN
jgi:hypothetical protein